MGINGKALSEKAALGAAALACGQAGKGSVSIITEALAIDASAALALFVKLVDRGFLSAAGEIVGNLDLCFEWKAVSTDQLIQELQKIDDRHDD